MTERALALVDIDGTCYPGIMMLPFAELQVQEGILPAAALEAMHVDLFRYQSKEWGYELFAQQILIDWAQGLEGRAYSDVLEQSRRFVQGQEENFYPFLSVLTRKLERTHDLYFITGEPQYLGLATHELFPSTGFLSTVFEVENGLLTGRVERFLAQREGKGLVIAPLLKKYGKRGSIALGDTLGDVEMLEMVENHFCVNPSVDLAKIACERSWTVAHSTNVISLIESSLK
ncbi:MAG: hypothetical protein C4562_06470 [Actinobacteria bacterium]|nr:MAG: hypothetical protein C4562_06470 [Actinomycetota bacterium]